MSTTRDEADSVIALLTDALGQECVTARAMFGEFGLYLDGQFFALICDARLYLKPTAAGLAAMRDPITAPPYPKAKPWLCPEAEDLDDPEQLAHLVRVTIKALG